MQGFHSESKVWVWDYDIHTAHLLTKTDCRQSGRRWEQLQVGKSEKCDHTPLTHPLHYLGLVSRHQTTKCLRYIMHVMNKPSVSPVKMQLAVSTNGELLYLSTPYRLCNRSIPVSGLEWNDEWKQTKTLGVSPTPRRRLFSALRYRISRTIAGADVDATSRTEWQLLCNLLDKLIESISSLMLPTSHRSAPSAS